MESLNEMAETTVKGYPIPLPQLRVLQVLIEARGPLTRGKLTERCGNKTPVVVGRAVGYSDPVKRAAFEQSKDGGGVRGRPCLSLLSRGYVEERLLNVAGLEELVVVLTRAGREFFEYWMEERGGEPLPPLRD